MIDLVKTKTFWSGIIGIVGAMGGVATGAMEVGQAVEICLTAIMGIFIRDGILKK